MSDVSESPMWRPSAERIAGSRLTAFMRQAERRIGRPFPDYESLYRWSIESPREFWPAVWEFCELSARRPWDEVLVDGDKMPGARWFVGAELNFAENLLRFDDDRIAIVSWNENGRQRSLSYHDLRLETARAAAALAAAGVRKGDRVAGILPNAPEAIVAMLATASLGGLWSSCSPDFGVAGIVDRFGQIEPKILLAVDGYTYNGKPFESLDRAIETIGKLPSVERLAVIPYLHPERRPALPDRGAWWPDLLAAASPRPLEFASLPFDHPLYVLYSSGTTGPPKCIVHGAGGALLQHSKEHVLHVDLSRDDVIAYLTTCGWMMWNWLASTLATGARLVLYDGAPLADDGRRVFEMAASERLTVFGTSAKHLSAIDKAGLEPGTAFDLSSLRTVLSTGSPLAPESYDYVYAHIKQDVCLASISGGTDIVSCFVLGNPIGPVYRGEIQARGLGMKVEVFDDKGRSIVGQEGELVCTAPFPSLPLGFWNDPDGARFREAYFEPYANVWRHGDFAEITARGGAIVRGRSDTVLNPGGVRIGTAEIYRVVEQLPEVLESVVVGQDWQGDVRVVLFVKLRPGTQFDPAFVERLRRHVRASATPRHVPAVVALVDDIPRTRSGKISETAVRNAIHGRPVKNTEALANPESLEQFRGRAELR